MESTPKPGCSYKSSSQSKRKISFQSVEESESEDLDITVKNLRNKKIKPSGRGEVTDLTSLDLAVKDAMGKIDQSLCLTKSGLVSIVPLSSYLPTEFVIKYSVRQIRESASKFLVKPQKNLIK